MRSRKTLLLLVFFFITSAADALPRGKDRYFPAESLGLNYLSHEVRLVAEPDSGFSSVDSTLKMTYVEFRLDTLVFEYRPQKDTATRQLRISKNMLKGFYYQPPIVGKSALVLGAGVIAVILLFVL